MYTAFVLMAAPAVVLGNNPGAAIDSSPSLRALASGALQLEDLKKKDCDSEECIQELQLEVLKKKDCDSEECIRNLIRQIRTLPAIDVCRAKTYDDAKCHKFFYDLYLKNFVCHKFKIKEHRDTCFNNFFLGTSTECIDCFGKVFEDPGFRWFWTCEAKCQAPTSAPTSF